MSIQGLDWQTVQFSLTSGLNTKAHGYALDPPSLSTCSNVEFDDVGGLRLRKPYASIGANIYPSGTLSSVRKIAVVGDELLAFTATALYSWSETLTAWVSRGEHLAVAVAEETRFGNPTDQVFADRAQLNGTVVMVWTEILATAATAYLAAYDSTTGAILVAPTSFGAGNSRPRVVALTTKILVTWDYGAGVYVKSIDPAAPAFAITGATGLSTASGARYDIMKEPGVDGAVFVARNSTGNAYEVGKVTAALVVTSSSKARTCDGIIALSCSSNGDRIVVLRDILATGVIKADLVVMSTLVDSTVNTTIGTAATAPVVQLTGAFRSTADGGFYRCYAYWDSTPAAVSGVVQSNMESNWIDTNAAIGTEDDTYLWDHAIASRAFSYDGYVYLWTVFAGESQASGLSATMIGLRAQFQNTYTLYRDDGMLVTKATWSRAGGNSYHAGHLPGVALISGTTAFAWAGTERQIIEVGGGADRSAYSARAPRDISLTFDSDDARRVVTMGRTAYVSGGLLLQYDGDGLTEVGFVEYPWFITASNLGGGVIPAGVYSYKVTYRWDNARGETERSTTAVGVAVTVVAATLINAYVPTPTATLKQGTRRYPAAEFWRTKAAAPVGAPFYLVTSRDPAATGNNGYVVATANSGSVIMSDNFTDAILETKEESPENGDVLPRLSPPGASILIASDARLFLAGIPGDPYAVHYSLLRNEGEVAGFHGTLRFTIPATTGAITALAIQGETIVVFTASAVYVVDGAGYDNTGGGSNYNPPRLVSSDVGALSHDTVALTPMGLVFFSRKGWYRLSLGWDLEYIGARVEGYNTDTWLAAQVVESQHQVRFLSASRMLVWDYLVNEWSEWTQTGGLGLAMWRTYPMLLDTAVKKEQSTFTSVDYSFDVELGWAKPAGAQGMVRVRRIAILGEYKAAHKQRVRLNYDYAAPAGQPATDDVSMTFSGLTAGNPTQLRMGPSRQRFEAIKVHVTITTTAGAVPAFDAVTLTGIAFEFGVKRGMYQRLPAAQKQ